MTIKIINILKINIFVFFINNIYTDFNLVLADDTSLKVMCKIKLKGDNNKILNDPTLCEGGFDKALKEGNINPDGLVMYENIKNYNDIKKNFIPVYFLVKNERDHIWLIDESDPYTKMDFNELDKEDVLYVVYCKRGYKNIVTSCFNEDIELMIKFKDFKITKSYIDNLLIHINSDSLIWTKKDVERYCTISISLQKDNITQNIAIGHNFYFKITDSFEYKITQYDVKGDNLLTLLNKSKNIRVLANDINKIFYQGNKLNYKINDKAKVYILVFNSEKYYIISEKTLKENELTKILRAKIIKQSEDLIFDTNQSIKFESVSKNVMPGEYKIISKQTKKIDNYKSSGDKNPSKCIKKTPDISSGTKVNVKSLFNDQDTNKYSHITNNNGKINKEINKEKVIDDKAEDINKKKIIDAINMNKNKIINTAFTNDQEIGPGRYELISKDKPKDISKDESGSRADLNGKEITGHKCKCCCQ